MVILGCHWDACTTVWAYAGLYVDLEIATADVPTLLLFWDTFRSQFPTCFPVLSLGRVTYMVRRNSIMTRRRLHDVDVQLVLLGVDVDLCLHVCAMDIYIIMAIPPDLDPWRVGSLHTILGYNEYLFLIHLAFGHWRVGSILTILVYNWLVNSMV